MDKHSFFSLSFVRFGHAPQHGLSLIEVLMVLAIMGIVAGVGGLGLLKDLPDYRLKSAVRELVSNMQWARVEAINRNMSCRVVFDVGHPRYAISLDNGADDDWSTIGDNDNLRVVSLSDYQSGVDFGNGNANFDATADQGSIPGDFVSYDSNRATFNSRGISQGDDVYYVYIENEQNNVYAVGSSPTGAIIIRRWQGSDWSD